MFFRLDFPDDFKDLYNTFQSTAKGRKMLKLEGIEREYFDVYNSSEKYFNEIIQDVSIDANANVQEGKNPNNFQSEVVKPYLKLYGYYKIWEILKEDYDLDEANRLLTAIWDGTYYFHDSTSIFNHYCYAFSSLNLLLEGRPYGQLHSKPPKRTDSFISQIIETVMDLSNAQAGAIAIGDLFINYAFFSKKEKTKEYQIKNDFQRMIHVLNNKFRTSAQAPFTNISIIDRPGIKKLFKDYYYPDGSNVDDYIDEIMRVQKIFSEIMKEGDPLNDNIPYRFPVCFPGYEKLFINNEITTFENAFCDYEDGWTDIFDEDIYTQHMNKPVKINRVYVGKTNKLLRFTGTNGKPIEVTPEHKFLMADGSFKKAKDICLADKIKIFCKETENIDCKKTIKLTDYLNDLWVIGNKIRKTDYTKELIKKYNISEHSFNGYNHKMSHSYDLIKDVEQNNDEEDFIFKSDIEIVKTKASKQKGAMINEISLDKNFGRFLGLFYAEGHLCKGEIGFSFNIEEDEYIDFVMSYMKDVLQIKSIIKRRDREEGNSTQVIAYNQTLYDILEKLIGKGAEYKFLSNELFNTPIEFRKGFIQGVIEGDGCCDKYNCVLTTISEDGSDCIMHIANTLGIRNTLSYISEVEKELFGRKYLRKKQYIIKFNKEDLLNNFNFSKMNLFEIKKSFNSTTDFHIRKIEEITTEKDITIYNVEVDNDEHLFTLPCGVITSNCTFNLTKNENNEIIDKEFLDFVCEMNYEKGNFNIYVAEGNKVASCCRLVNDLTELKGGDSFGNGGISIGSSRVVTLNLPRIAHEVTSITPSTSVYDLLDQRIDDIKKIQLAHRKLLKSLIDQGFLMFFKPLNWINLDKHLFATIGITGFYEFCKEIEYDIDSNEARNVLSYFDKKRKQLTKETGVMFNVEQIPGESTVIKFAEKDAILGYNNKYELYSNQFIPLTEDIEIIDRIRIDGSLVSKLSGGGITHLNIDEPLRNKEQMNKIISLSIKYGMEHFAINYGFGKCENGHMTICGNKTICSKCGSKIKEHYTRVVGYLTKVDNWTKKRREIEFPERKFKTLKGEENE